MMIHSVLSGPKTPLRAIIGTATHTFLRPLAMTTLGATTRLPFTGDTRTIRAGSSIYERYDGSYTRVI